MKKEKIKLSYHLRNISDLTESIRNLIKIDELDETYNVYIDLIEDNMNKVKDILKDYKN